MSRVRVVGIVGPTATGKTELALELAERTGAEIVSADARQIYRGLDVGTAKPTAAERARVPHHCLDLADPTEHFDVGRYRAAAAAAIADVAGRRRPVVLVGGTGLYVRALTRGLCEGVPAHSALRAALSRAEEGTPGLLARWADRLDPAGTRRIHPHDRVRLVRLVEVALATGRPLSARQGEHGFAERPYDVLLIGLDVPPPEIDARIAGRLDAMIAHGWLDEVRALADALPVEAPAWATLGYRELRDAVTGHVALPEALAATARATRRFAKRQRTWFRREAGLVWRDPMRERRRILDDAFAFLVAKPEDAG
jgi:tRNA dimethylallyltransferase